VKLCARNKVRSEERKIRSEEKKKDLNALCSKKVKVEDSERKRSDLQKRGKICKLCSLIKVRIVKSS
jgi:hypothetical protein